MVSIASDRCSDVRKDEPIPTPGRGLSTGVDVPLADGLDPI